MALLSLLSMIIPLSIILIIHGSVSILVSAAVNGPSAQIKCQTGWTNTPIVIGPSQINDGYCDCPHDGLDEPNTGACSGSMDGMWAGIPPKYESSDYDAAHLPTTYFFSCPQQPSLKLPPSRVNDGICDCCDGADEFDSIISSSTIKCPDICGVVLAEERAARAKSLKNYEIGSKKRQESIEQYKVWYEVSESKLEQLKDVDVEENKNQLTVIDTKLTMSKLQLAKDWQDGVLNQVHESTLLKAIVHTDHYDTSDLASFIISLCWLSAEVSSDNTVTVTNDGDDRCLAFDRASLDIGLLWDYSSSNQDDDNNLPTYNTLVQRDDDLIEYADKIMLRLDGKDKTATGGGRSSSSGNKKKREYKPPPEPEYSSGDDPYGDDWHDSNHHDHYDDDHLDHHDDDYTEEYDEDYEHHNRHDKESEHSSSDGEGESDAVEEPQEEQLSSNEVLVKSLLDNVPLDRTLFKAQSQILLDYSPPEEVKSDDIDGEGAEEESTGGGNEEDGAKSSGFDPMALRMVKSSINKHLSNISRGEAAAKSTARYIASIIDKEADNIDLRNLAIMTMYHSKLSSDDIAELIYSTSKSLLSLQGKENHDECITSWGTMCSPLPGYPPSYIADVATKICDEREASSSGVCYKVQEEGAEIDVPVTITDGYYNYYAPKARKEDDGITSYFAGIDNLHQKSGNSLAENVAALKKEKTSIDNKIRKLTKQVDDLEREVVGGEGGNSKYGLAGELYGMRDTCFKVESGKYEYETCVFGKATQRDIGQTSGGTHLGNFEKVELNEEDGQRTLMWGSGTKCWNGPSRSAEVVVTCGAENKLLTADEPETCRYVFTMESPIGCDEKFKQNLNL